MFSARALKIPAVFCSAILAICTLATHPFVEMGQCDDFSYVRSAKALAETGHIVYYGWASAMLGWQLALGALFIKLFGFSFTAANASVLLVSMATAFLLQRTFVRLGLREVNAAFATLTLVLSPLFIPLSFSFMSDIPGLFAIVFCLYLCLRAIESPLPSQTTAWLIAAAVFSALLGTARQTGWLGTLVIVPSACFLLRRRRLPFIMLGAVWTLCAVFIFGCLHWFSQQMYATVETSRLIRVDQDHLFGAAQLAVRAPLEVAFFLAPILIAFVSPFVKQHKRLTYLALAGVLVFCTYHLIRPDSYWLGFLLAPASSGGGNYVTEHGILELPEIGIRPVVLHPAVRVVITIICYFSAFAFCVLLVAENRRGAVRNSEAQPAVLSWRQMLLLLMPFTLVYCGFLAIRVLSGTIFDRYLLSLFMVLAVVAMRFYQDTVSPRLPRVCFAALLLFAGYGVAGTHDMFSEDRARLAAIEKLRAAGLPRTAFYGGFPYDGWTQIEAQGYVDVDDIKTPTGVHHLSRARDKFKPCGYWHARFYPAIRPQYVLSYDNFTCGESQDRFAPVAYRLWLPPFSSEIYIRSVSPESLREPGQ
jgi:hypothetical protein